MMEDYIFWSFAFAIVGVAAFLLLRQKPYRQIERKPVQTTEE